MPNLGDWEKEIDENMTEEQAAECAAAIRTLMAWPMFAKEWAWTGFRTLGLTLEHMTKTKKENAK